MLPCRLIVDSPQDGAWNMAVDEALLDDAATDGSASLRFYQWREPTLSLGYFQSYQERYSHAPSRDVATVRRPSGGGALLHDRELTYSICVPAGDRLARDSESLYSAVHRVIINVIAEWNLVAAIHADLGAVSAADEEPFLCFTRRTAADVVLCSADANSSDAAAKIVGSAQRRRRGAVLQHGAILLDRSPSAPELPGVNDLAGAPVTTADDLAARLEQPLAAALGLELRATPLPSQIRETAQRLQREKYSHRSWIQRR
jgi:lipoate-protein ligase A